MKDSLHNKCIFGFLGIILVLLIVVSLVIGRYFVPLSDVMQLIQSVVLRDAAKADPTMYTVLWNVRFPRILLACLVGAALSLAGCSYQTIFHNPMASPDILGASSGACFGAALGILFGLPYLGVVALSFCMSLFTILLVYFIYMFAKEKSLVSVLLSGIVVGSLFSSATSYIKLVADPNNQLPQITYWLMGSLAGAKHEETLLAFLVILIAAVPLFVLRWRMNFLTLPDDEAKAMGVNIRVLRLVVIFCATLLTAAAVSFSGMIGWVGLAVPHLCRYMVGNNVKRLVPACVLSGAIFLLLIDNISRTLLNVEIPIGILTAFIGAPFFILMFVKGERG